MDTGEKVPNAIYRNAAQAIFWIANLVCVLLVAVHYFQPDRLAPVTLVPPWLWIVPGMFVILIARKSVSRVMLIFAIGLWFVFGFLFVEEARSLLRFQSFGPDARQSDQPSTIRIVSLNCCMGSKKASVEPIGFQPDIVFFQESQGPIPTLETAKEYFGKTASAVHGGDVSIISNAKLDAIHVDPQSHFVHVAATFADGRQCDLVCLRLSAPVFRMDFLSAGFWNDHRNTRQNHREQLQEIISHLENAARTKHWIIGGDFNLVGNDGALSAFENLRDTFFRAGSGWCDTGTSDYPLFHVDQVWTSQNIRCERQKVHRTENSDHRMVVVDLTF